MIKDELIGKKISVVESKNKSLEGITGIVVDETKNLLFIESDGEVKKVVKDLCVFEIDGKRIEGKEITQRPEERIKK